MSAVGYSASRQVDLDPRSTALIQGLMLVWVVLIAMWVQRWLHTGAGS
jgi:hypothetical protein